MPDSACEVAAVDGVLFSVEILPKEKFESKDFSLQFLTNPKDLS